MKTLDKLLLSTSVWGVWGSRGDCEGHPHIPTDVRCSGIVSTPSCKAWHSYFAKGAPPGYHL